MSMRGRSGGGERRRRVWVSGANRAELVAALAKAIGFDVVDEDGGELDLRVVEVDRVDELPSTGSMDCPLMVVATRRLGDAEAAALRAAGAQWVLDGDATLLDAAFALSELLFRTIAEQRRYWRDIGGAPVRFYCLNEAESEASDAALVGVAREGGLLRTRRRPEEGTPIEIALDLPYGPARIRGRVAFVSEDGFAIEFALDDQNVAPKLVQLIPGRRFGPRLVGGGRGLRLKRRDDSNATLS